MLTREKTLEIVRNLPEEFSIDELLERLMLLAKIEHAMIQADNGQTVSTEEARKMLAKWLN